MITAIDSIAAVRAALLMERCDPTHPSVVAALQQAQSLKGQEATDWIKGGIALAQDLYRRGQLQVGLQLALACRQLAPHQGNPRLMWQTATVAGIFLTYSGKIMAGLEAHGTALQLAQSAQNAGDQATSWNNLGVALTNACAYELAIDCYHNAINFQLGSFGHWGAQINIAQCFLHLGCTDQGLVEAELALALECSEYRSRDPYSCVILRNNYARLLLQAQRPEDAEIKAKEASAIAAACGIPRALNLALLTQAAVDAGFGRYQQAIAAMEAELTSARADPRAYADTLWSLAMVEKAAGQTGRAKIYLEELYSITAKATISELGATLGLRQPNDYVSYGVDCLAALEKQIAETETDWPSWDKADHFERIAQAVHLANQQDAWYGERVGGVARFLALECGFDRHYAREIGRAAKLHDIGLTLVRHPGLKQCLSEESGTMAHHTDEGARLLGQSSQHPRALLAATIAHYHHERWDGDGCHGVAGQVIPEPARIVAVAIAVVELYKKHGSADIVCTALAADVGAFDPKIVKTCCRSVQSGYLRRLLPRLGQGRHAFDHIIKGFTQNG